MKNITLVLFLFSLFAVNACKEKPEPEPTPVVNMEVKFDGCLLLSQTEDGQLIEYTYSTNHRIIEAKFNNKTTEFKYDNDNRIIEIVNGSNVAELTYSNSQIYPDRIEIRDDDILAQYLVIEQKNMQLTKVKTYNNYDSINAEQVLALVYDNQDSLIQMVVDIYDFASKGYYRFIDARNIETDGNPNPLFQSFATLYMNITNPFAYSKLNIIDADLFILGQPSNFNSSYTYNEDDYPLTADINIPGFVKSLEFTYKCAEK
ncbi:hypothetical protein GYB22_07545 [bacterium]|nr:hypothetical protein [bacterium]